MTIPEQIDAGLDPTDVAIIAALVAGASTADAASAAGVSATTVYRRMSQSAFRVALAEARAGLWKPDAERLRCEVMKSIERLVAIRDNDGTHNSTRLRACETIIRLAIDLHELAEVGPRLAALETKLQNREASPQYPDGI